MRIYKPGDKVRILKAVRWDGYDLSDEYTTGDICEVAEDTDSDGDTRVWSKDKSDYFCFAKDSIEPVEKTWDTLTQGDVLVDVDGEEYVVQGVIGEAVLYTRNTGDENRESAHIDSKLELQRDGDTIKQSEQTEELVEITLSEIAKLKGIPVEKLRVKE